ncbi:hypothetical protein MTOK_44250 [Mycolicibacterium tokaiense]|nr:hypothetical protein MTOK_44250 [Mycolicibacterium tokaiense]
MLEGFSPPTVEQVADRAGVSTASVFRYFDTLDELRDETTRRYFQRFAHLLEIPEIGQGTLDARITRFVDIRHELYVATAPMARMVRNRAPRVAALHDILHRHRAGMARDVRRHFATELDGLGAVTAGEMVGTIATLTSFEAWSELTEDHRRTPAQIRRGWARALSRVLTG